MSQMGRAKDTHHRVKAILAQTYQPILMGYFGVAAIYYAVMSVTHFWSFEGAGLSWMLSASIPAMLGGVTGVWLMRRPRTLHLLELTTTAVNCLVLANVMVALSLEFSESKLVYFIMMAMIFAFASVSMRQALVSISLTFVALYIQLSANIPEQLSTYLFLGFAAAVSSIGIAYFLKRAIGLAVGARQAAELARIETEIRLEAAEKLGETRLHQSMTDSLTALPNRRAFFETLSASIQASASGDPRWLCLLDLDGFKAVNDNYGHIIGDALLKAVAERLRSYCEDEADICRMGGDEFNMIARDSRSPEEMHRWCSGLLEEIAKVYLIDDRLIQISGSIGCCTIEIGEGDLKLLQMADYALLHAKRNGKNRVILFRDEHAKDATERFHIEQALRVANFDSEIELLFQPQVDLDTGHVECAEALARWNSPIIGQVGPSRFIEIAEESGLIAKITLAVVDKALTAISSWSRPIRLSINLSGHDLLSDQVVDQIIDLVARSGVNPELIEFEVTETAMLSDTERATANLKKLSELGHSIALDDFGTGYCNFAYLRSLPISKLKIDRSFVENLGDPMTEKILDSLAGIARTLDVHCLLEGIEDELELLVAKRVRARSVQGYLFGKPMSAGELLTFIEQESPQAGRRVASKR